ncbi:hypothetical protein J6590_104679 [Homalodisca vitripennis]|nr:hypothetical protein J6590_104679 [Homalodisca vitripennis]
MISARMSDKARAVTTQILICVLPSLLRSPPSLNTVSTELCSAMIKSITSFNLRAPVPPLAAPLHAPDPDLLPQVCFHFHQPRPNRALLFSL